MKFKSFDMDQIASDAEIESLLQKVQQGETANTISSVNETLMKADYLISIISRVVPQRFERGTYAYITKGDGAKHKFGDQGTRIMVVVASDYYDLTISREQTDDSPRVRIGLDQNVKRQIEKEIIDKYKFNNGVEF